MFTNVSYMCKATYHRKWNHICLQIAIIACFPYANISDSRRGWHRESDFSRMCLERFFANKTKIMCSTVTLPSFVSVFEHTFSMQQQFRMLSITGVACMIFSINYICFAFESIEEIAHFSSDTYRSFAFS